MPGTATLVIARRHGALGNRMFLHAHVMAAAIEHGCRLANPSFLEYAPFFEQTARDACCRYPPQDSRLPAWPWLRRAGYRLLGALAWLLRTGVPLPGLRLLVARGETVWLDREDFRRSLRPGESVLLDGWLFRCHALFRKHAAEIRRFFTPAEPHRRRVAEAIARARKNCEVLVGVHIRQGDYREFQGGRYYFETPQYAQVMRRIASLFPGRRVGFLICSDQRQEPRHFEGLEHGFGTGHPVEDMYALAECDYLLATMSTFALWASFHGEKPLYLLRDPQAPLTLAQFRVFNEDLDD